MLCGHVLAQFKPTDLFCQRGSQSPCVCSGSELLCVTLGGPHCSCAPPEIPMGHQGGTNTHPPSSFCPISTLHLINWGFFSSFKASGQQRIAAPSILLKPAEFLGKIFLLFVSFTHILLCLVLFPGPGSCSPSRSPPVLWRRVQLWDPRFLMRGFSSSCSPSQTPHG